MESGPFVPLVAWRVVGEGFGPSDAPAFDYTIWTGSVVRADDGTWDMFYTGSSRTQQGLKQRVGPATFADLSTWRKHGREALVSSDGRWYEQLGDRQWADEAWRNLWVFRDSDGDGWHMQITARARTDPGDQRGVIGHARSHDLLAWEVMPPLSALGPASVT